MTDHATPPAPAATAGSMATALAAHAAKRQALVNGAATRTAQLATTMAKLFAAGRGPDAIAEFFAVQAAVQRRLFDQQRDFAAGLQALAAQWRQLPSANSLTNLMAQESNLAAQYGLLLSAQATSLLEVAEGVTVGYGYWAERHYAEVQATAAPPAP